MKITAEATKNESFDPRAQELDGLVDFGMKRESLRLARRYLKGPHVNAELFNAATRAIWVHGDSLKSWIRLIDAAYSRLSKKSKQSLRFEMLGIYHHVGDDNKAIQFIPKRFTKGQYTDLDLVLAMETLLALKEIKRAKNIAERMARCARDCENPTIKATLMNGLAEYFVSTGDWRVALDLWKVTQNDSVIFYQSVLGIIEIHVAYALQTVRHGLQLIKKFRENPDAELETTLPGNESNRMAKAQKTFLGREKLLERLLTKQRQKEFRLTKSDN